MTCDVKRERPHNRRKHAKQWALRKNVRVWLEISAKTALW